MVQTTCSKCGHELTDQAWGCPQCGGETGAGQGKEISSKGMMMVLLLFIVFPILVFIVHLFVPGM